MKDERILRWTEDHREEFVKDLAALCAIRSVRGEAEENKPFGPGPAEALALALQMCEKYGLNAKNYDNYAGSADLCPEKPPMLDILAHLDVVPEGDGWQTDPYTLVRENDCLYARGVSDDKGGLLAAMYAMRCVRDLGLPLSHNCRLILGTDEESGMEDTLHYYLKNKPAPYTTTPDANWPVCNVEKGFYRPEFSKEFPEETALPRVTAYHAGQVTNAVPGEATATVVGLDAMTLGMALMPLAAEIGVTFDAVATDFGAELTVCGQGCHASLPETGNNANTALLHLLCQLPLADCESTRALRAVNGLFPHGDWSGKAAGIAIQDEISGALTCAFTRLDLAEGKLRGICDCRVALSATEENCRLVLEQKMRELGFEISGEMLPGHHTDAQGEFIQTLLRCYEQYSGREGYCFAMGGGTYVHHIPGGVAFGIEPPDYDTRMHGPNERMPLGELMQAVEIYAAVIAELCGAKE